jgi:hypothetical protein
MRAEVSVADNDRVIRVVEGLRVDNLIDRRRGNGAAEFPLSLENPPTALTYAENVTALVAGTVDIGHISEAQVPR